jgi:S-adenosyl-L-methionine hydrolase (adenosine-forming)
MPRQRLRSAPDPIIALLTDFGETDGFVGQMKGVILGISRRARLVDISHAVPPQDVATAARLLETSYPSFPRGTLFLCVVDPGVGSDRLPVAVRTGFGYFVAPDNGLLTPILEACPGAEVRAIEHPLLRRAECSATFHGRDLFAVAAARLAAGFLFSRTGPLVPSPVRLELPRAVVTTCIVRGEVLSFDHFGNGATSIRAADLAALGPDPQVNCAEIPFGLLRKFYSQVGPGSPLALIDSAGRLELAVRNGSAAAIGIKVGAYVEVRPAADPIDGTPARLELSLL